MKNILTMRVTAVMPNVDLTDIDLSINSLTNVANGLPEGETKSEMLVTLASLNAQREQVRAVAERDMVHVELLDDDSGSDPVGAANFLAPSGEFKEGIYKLTAEEVIDEEEATDEN